MPPAPAPCPTNTVFKKVEKRKGKQKVEKCYDSMQDWFLSLLITKEKKRKNNETCHGSRGGQDMEP